LKLSISIDHTPWRPERRENLKRMLEVMQRNVTILDTDYRGKPWEDVKQAWALEKWRYHLATDATHHLMLSDDLALMPQFVQVVEAMISMAPEHAIGLMSNHPMGPRLLERGHHWYRCRSWLVGPAILMPRAWLEPFVEWYEPFMASLPPGNAYGQRGFFHDDSSINEWISRHNRTSLHPLPAPIEHQLELGRTHDSNPFPKYACEAISWRCLDYTRMLSPEWWADPDNSRLLEVV
jgi:hypothetical protein